VTSLGSYVCVWGVGFVLFNAIELWNCSHNRETRTLTNTPQKQAVQCSVNYSYL